MVPRGDVQLEEVAHLSLQVGRLLLANGADTAEVRSAVTRFAGGYGCEAHLVVTYEALLLTLLAAGRFRTKAGLHVPGMNVNLSAVETLNRIIDEAALGRLELDDARRRLDGVERGLPGYPRIVVIAGLGLTAASLATLFGGNWTVFVVVFLAGACGTWVRQELVRRHCNALLVPFVAALISGAIGGVGLKFGTPGITALCLIAPGMIIVPGVPLINGILDIIRNHMTLGLARLSFAGLAVLAIAFGLFAATVVVGVQIPVDGPTQPLPIATDALFSGLAVVGYVFLFNVPLRLYWACLVCGICSHTLRTAGMHLGIDIVSGTLLGSLAAGFLSLGFARGFRAPPAAFAFPGVVAMVPGSYAFRAVIGSLHILQAGAKSPPSLIAETASLTFLSVLMMAAIAIGLAAPLAFTQRAASS